MATNTEHYNLIKPGQDDFYNVDDFNGNADIVDGVLQGKVDKVSGKGLSTNDYTTAEKAKVASIDNKVDKVSGKGLSTNDYDAAEKSKVAAAVPNTRKVNGKALSADITLNAADVGADTSGAAESALKTALAASGTTTGTPPNFSLAQSGFTLTDGATVRIKLHDRLVSTDPTGNRQMTLNVNSTGNIEVKSPTLQTIDGQFGAMNYGKAYAANTWHTVVYSLEQNAWILQSPSVSTFNGRTGYITPQSGDYSLDMIDGVLPVTKGGTGASSFGSSRILLGNGSGPFYQVSYPGGTEKHFLVQSTTATPTWMPPAGAAKLILGGEGVDRGVWTPELVYVNPSGGVGSIPTNLLSGEYSLIGDILWFKYNIKVQSVPSVDGSSIIQVRSLPFSIVQAMFAVGGYFYNLKTAWSMIYAFSENLPRNHFSFRGTKTPATNSVVNLSISDLNPESYFIGSAVIRLY